MARDNTRQTLYFVLPLLMALPPPCPPPGESKGSQPQEAVAFQAWFFFFILGHYGEPEWTRYVAGGVGLGDCKWLAY